MYSKDKRRWKFILASSLEGNGVSGIDLNADHIAYVEQIGLATLLKKRQ